VPEKIDVTSVEFSVGVGASDVGVCAYPIEEINKSNNKVIFFIFCCLIIEFTILHTIN